MLEEIRIKNFALIEEAVLEFHAGFSVITGETGAGKSMILDALSFLFGELPADRSWVRRGASRMEVSARLRISARPSRQVRQALKHLEDLGVETGGGILELRRFYDTETSRSRLFMNDSPAAVSALKFLARAALTFHRQGKTESLFEADFSGSYLDDWAALETHLESYQKAWAELAQARRARQEQRDRLEAVRSRADFFKFQLQEFEGVSLDAKSLRRLREDLPLWKSKEAVVRTASEAQSLILEGEAPASGQAARAAAGLEKIAGQFSDQGEIASMAGDLRQAQALMDSVSGRLTDLMERLEHNPEGLEEMLAAKARLERLSAKHRAGNWEDLEAVRDAIERDLNALENAEAENAFWDKRLEVLETDLNAAARRLSAERVKAARSLEAAMRKELEGLGFSGAVFKPHLEILPEPGEKGAESVEFLFAPNPGEGMRPLRQIASSGEASRLMLAFLAASAAQTGSISGGTFVLDEIEQGLSAQMTAAVGKKLQTLAASTQIIAVTHSPILACLAQTHYRVEKRTASGRTAASLRMLSAEGRREEALRLAGAGNGEDRRTLEPYIESLFERAGAKTKEKKEAGVK